MNFKTNKNYLDKLIIVGTISLSSTFAYAEDNKNKFVSIETGTGVQFEYGYDLNDKFTLRSTLNYIPIKKNVSWSKTKFDVKAKVLTTGINLDYFPFEGSNHYLSVGLHYNGTKVDADGKRTFTYGKRAKNKIDAETNLEIKYNKVAPYLGFGYRETINLGFNNHKVKSKSSIEFTYNVGVLYQGKAKINHGDFCATSGMLAGNCLKPNDEILKTYAKNYNYDKYMNYIHSKTNKKFIPVVQIGLVKRF